MADSSNDMTSRPTCMIVLGMAGSGKTTFVQKVTTHLKEQSKPHYVINLDPAVSNLPFHTNIDIQDTVKYKDVMKQFNLGPNGAIMTSLNLFATHFGQVMSLVEKRAPELDYVIADTPGQIEVFTWSASGTIITDSFASTIPTVVVYVMDTARCTNPTTFMSNMLYACSILYKTKLPFVVVMNKTDIVDHQFAVKWTTDFTAFDEALQNDTSYISVLSRSMSLVLDEFYEHLKLVGFSSKTGEGMEDLLKAIGEAREEYFTDYKPEYDEAKKRRKSEAEKESSKATTQRMGLARDGLVITKGTEDSSENYGNEDDNDVETEGDVESLSRYFAKKVQLNKRAAAAASSSSSK